eukprot:TRINITY_DN75614_c0_g1_i1.p1 TRINITY_DN75614_c0_g1~~TRINITY_DN75614_c0_g1_i1.p1  ORF type:complete len:193 (-),score=34.06 TRINITY_DN75614_c0_g1_i1:36-587(-)
MEGTHILQSIKLDSTSSCFGLPHFAPGKQPCFPIVPSETERISSGAIEQVLKDLNQKLQETGCPPFPLFLIPIVLALIITLILLYGFEDSREYLSYLWMPWALLMWTSSAIFSFYNYKQKTGVHRILQDWNNSVGLEHGVHLLPGLEGRGNGTCCCPCQRALYLHVCQGRDQRDRLDLNCCGC